MRPEPEVGASELELAELSVGGARVRVLSFDRLPGWIERRLTEAERAVLELILDDVAPAEIARRRSTSARTVANQLASIYRNLGVLSRTELMALLGQPEPPLPR